MIHPSRARSSATHDPGSRSIKPAGDARHRNPAASATSSGTVRQIEQVRRGGVVAGEGLRGRGQRRIRRPPPPRAALNWGSTWTLSSPETEANCSSARSANPAMAASSRPRLRSTLKAARARSSTGWARAFSSVGVGREVGGQAAHQRRGEGEVGPAGLRPSGSVGQRRAPTRRGRSACRPARHRTPPDLLRSGP